MQKRRSESSCKAGTEQIGGLKMAQFSIPIEDIVDLLGLERSPRNHPGARSIKVHCPFCGHDGYTMDVDVVSCVYHCFHCPEEMQKHTGALDLYSRVRLGAPSYQMNPKKVYHRLCKELEGKSTWIRNMKGTVPKDNNIYPAEDTVLNDAYSALLRLSYLKLSRKHIENLMARGLPEKTARRGLFASVPQSAELLREHPDGKKVSSWYWSQGIDETRKNSPILSKYRWRDMVAGILIADYLVKQGISLKGVPGFYQIISGRWALRYDTGMLIPTISYEGNIVGIQTRRDVLTKNGLRYMTLSSKGLPEGVTAGIARTHVIHSRESITCNTQVYVTEGPLKADIILWYLTRWEKQADIAVIALQGVKNTKEIPAIAEKLRKVGITRVYTAFDMDKCGNTAVAEADKTLRKLFRDAGISVETLVWDSEFAKEKKEELLSLALSHDIPFTPTENDFADIGKLAQIFTKQHIEYNTHYINGKRIKDHWRAETKGYDDYLHCLETCYRI